MEEYKTAYNLAVKMLASYPRTVFEVRNKLRKKGFQEEIIAKIIKRLEEEKILSDEEYAKLWLENQLKYRPSGRNLCRKKMINRGLANDLVSRVLESDFSDEREIKLATLLVSRKLEEIENKSLKKKSKISKLGQYLDSKGFSEYIIWQVLEELGLLN